MIGVGENERSADRFQLNGREHLDIGEGANGGKDRGEQVAMRGGEDASPGAAYLRVYMEVKHEGEL